jgi:hypothetical protein
MTLSVANGVPGIWFYDAQTGELMTDTQTGQPLMQLTWGWTIQPGVFDPVRHVWDPPPHWVPAAGGLQPPASVKIGPSGAQPGVPHSLALALTVWDGQRQVTAQDGVLVVPIAISESVEKNVDPVRKLWFFGFQQGHPPQLVDAANYSEEMTLSVPAMPGIQGSADFTYVWTTEAGAGKIRYHDVNGPLDTFSSDPGVRDVLVLSNEASEAQNDVKVKVKVNGQDAAVAELTVYSPTRLFREQRHNSTNPKDAPSGSGYTTTYWWIPADNLGTALPLGTNLEDYEAFSDGHALVFPCNWVQDIPDPGWSPWLNGQGFADYYYREEGVPAAVHPDNPVAADAVYDEVQEYWTGHNLLEPADEGPGILLDRHTLHWHRGYARVDPETDFYGGP